MVVVVSVVVVVVGSIVILRAVERVLAYMACINAIPYQRQSGRNSEGRHSP